MKALFNLTMTLFLVGAVLVSCKKEETNSNNNTPGQNPFTTSLSDRLEQEAPQPESFIINTHINQTIQTSKYGRYSFPPNAFADMNGVPVSGNVNVKVTEYFDNADLFYAGLSTRSDDEWLVTGGQFKIEATMNGQPLQIADGVSFNAFVPNNEADYNMELFVGEELPDGSLNWLPTEEGGDAVDVIVAQDSSNCAAAFYTLELSAGDELSMEYVSAGEDPQLHSVALQGNVITGFGIDPGVTNSFTTTIEFDGQAFLAIYDEDWDGWEGAYLNITINGETFQVTIDSEDCEPVPFSYYYNVELTTLGWINCDYFAGQENLASLTIVTEEEHDCSNTVIYTVFNDLDIGGTTFCDGEVGNAFNAYNMPENTSVTICALSLIDEQYYGAFISVNVSGETTQNITLTEMSLEDFETQINNL